jgi:hypothetical protein
MDIHRENANWLKLELMLKYLEENRAAYYLCVCSVDDFGRVLQRGCGVLQLWAWPRAGWMAVCFLTTCWQGVGHVSCACAFPALDDSVP